MRLLHLCSFALLPAVALLASPAHAIENPHPWATGQEASDDPRFEDASQEFHPWVHYPKVRTVDLSSEGQAAGDYIAAPPPQPNFHSLDSFKMSDEAINADPPTKRDPEHARSGGLPDGWVQRGNVVLPNEVAEGLTDVGTGPIHAVTDIPGNKYPRKHTLFLNFNGGMLFTGADNSAIDKSNLAKQGVYPTFGGGESTALAIVQAVEADLAQYGVTVIYDFRPRQLVPYTMQMMGGSWQDTNIDSPAGGVAPGADCGALGQRHVVYTFSNGGSVLGAANTASQEAGHAWGLDHTLNCNSVMSYCGGGDGSFQNGCATLCEAQCQGPMTAGCRLTHEMFCGEDSDQQDDAAEMEWIFGGNEPDVEAPTIEIVSPVDGLELEEGGSAELRAVIDDNYGGFGWQFIVTKDGEEIYNQPDYDRDVDADFRAALNLVGLEAGVYVITVEAEDQFENVTVESVTVFVGGATTTGESETGGETGDDTSDSASGTGGGEDESASAGEGTGNGIEDDDSPSDEDDEGGDDESSGGETAGEVDDRGCGCAASDPRSGWASGLLLILGLGWMRRRRAA